MLHNRGVVVNVASVLGHVSSGRLEQASYAASKGAVVNLTRELAVLWARRNVRVNALCPGFFQTELTDKVFESESGLRYLSQRTPMGRNGQLHELDGALLFLASDASSFVTGQSIIVDGGWAAQ
jgi:NAD(P)-dependent dehydrogenase (short-subunit alcohol dehydrogenase family)